jgi:hypothetical protein
VGVWWMDRATFLPASWEDLRWWVNTAKRLVNDISGRHPCGTRSVVAKVEGHFTGKVTQPFDLTPDLCEWVSCEFRNQVEVALIVFAKARRPIPYSVAKGQEEALKTGRAWCLHALLGFDGRKWRIIYMR